MKAYQRETQLRTAGGLSIKDITEEVREAVRASGIRDGICSVYSPHTTCSVRVNEFETGFLEDFALLLKRLVPSDDYYAHDDWDRRTENVCPEDMNFGNGHSHCMSMLLGPAGESIPVRDAEPPPCTPPRGLRRSHGYTSQRLFGARRRTGRVTRT